MSLQAGAWLEGGLAPGKQAAKWAPKLILQITKSNFMLSKHFK
jgi:hypothetical protein